MTVLAAIIGAIAGVLGTYLFQCGIRREEHEKVRAAIEIELNRNDKALCEFWDEANRETTCDDAFNNVSREIQIPNSAPILRVLTKNLPQWSFAVWKSHIATAALAYKPSKFNRVYQYYENLPRIANIYSQFIQLDGDDLHNVYDNEERKRRGELWVKLERLVEETNELAQLVKGEKRALSTASRIRAKIKPLIMYLKKGQNKMTNENDEKYIKELVAHSEETLALLSNQEKRKRERMVGAAFLRCLGIGFSPNDVESPQDDPPDVTFQDANFEVRELLDKGRRRGYEYKERHVALTQATSIEDTLLPYTSPTPISYKKIFELVTAALSGKAFRYGERGCSNLDALVYVNLQHRLLNPNTDMGKFDSLVAQGWRSVSFVIPPYSHVIFAHDTAPAFLKAKAGGTKQEWNDSDTFFELN